VAISTVLLDAGGVILDETKHERTRAQLAVELLTPFVAGYSIEDYRADVEQGVTCFCPHVYRYVFWKHLAPDRGRFDGVWQQYVDRCRQSLPPLCLSDGIGPELHALSKNFNLAIAGQYGRTLLDLLDEHGLLKCFAFRFTQDDFAVTKPDPRHYEQIAQACGVDPIECIMVGDRIDKDVVPARQVGMRTIRLRLGLHKRQEPRTPDEIPDAELAGVKGLAETAITLAARH
jgi:FMN phosphatase YigB (HAD superfamily)